MTTLRMLSFRVRIEVARGREFIRVLLLTKMSAASRNEYGRAEVAICGADRMTERIVSSGDKICYQSLISHRASLGCRNCEIEPLVCSSTRFKTFLLGKNGKC